MNTFQNPITIYQGAFQDVFANCNKPDELTIIVNRNSRLFDIVLNNKRNIVPILVFDELTNYGYPKQIVRFFEYVHNNFVRCGIPLPVPGTFWIPLMSYSKTRMICGEPIMVDGIKSGAELCDKYADALRKIHDDEKKKNKGKKHARTLTFEAV